MAAPVLLNKQELTIDSADMFYVENHSPENSVTFGWANRMYTIGPMKKRLVPFDVICLYFGDPRSKVGQIVPFTDSTGSGHVPERYAEVKRLCVRYGVYEQGMDNIKGSWDIENARLLADGKPALRGEVFDCIVTNETGDVIIPPLFDHDGSESNIGFNIGDQSSEDVATILSNLRNRIDQLEGQKEALDERGGNNDDEGIGIDNPSII
jgi:hypothetical protein